ncbi:MAG: lipopolysaccharide biosynthesis protein RfbH, partial [Candidatus Omnitrophica bacterium]|nr:lipopolysaccharide biosynthesis protein RfbH [Candidatus Omnitrophota bacterium]
MAEKLKKEILNKVKEFYFSQKAKDKFIPGSSPVRYAGRVYDYRELVNLVDASLEFWLTTGRYAAEFEKKLAGFLGV